MAQSTFGIFHLSILLFYAFHYRTSPLQEGGEIYGFKSINRSKKAPKRTKVE